MAVGTIRRTALYLTDLDGERRAIGWFAYGLLALILLPLPHALSSTFGLHCPYL